MFGYVGRHLYVSEKHMNNCDPYQLFKFFANYSYYFYDRELKQQSLY